MGKYCEEIVERICNMISEDSYTIPEICKAVGISETTYHQWKIDHTEFADSIKKAADKFDENLLTYAKRSLVKLVKGYSVEESKTVYEPKDKSDPNAAPKIKEQTITKKHYQPSVPAVIFTLTNRDPENWKNRQNSEVTGKDGKDLIPARTLTKKEAKELLDDLENEC